MTEKLKEIVFTPTGEVRRVKFGEGYSCGIAFYQWDSHSPSNQEYPIYTCTEREVGASGMTREEAEKLFGEYIESPLLIEAFLDKKFPPLPAPKCPYCQKDLMSCFEDNNLRCALCGLTLEPRKGESQMEFYTRVNNPAPVAEKEKE